MGPWSAFVVILFSYVRNFVLCDYLLLIAGVGVAVGGGGGGGNIHTYQFLPQNGKCSFIVLD